MAFVLRFTLPPSLHHCCGDDSTGSVTMQGPHSDCVLMPLSDLIQQVPRLLELMPAGCFAALIATSTTHRSQIHNYVTSITISDPTHASDLISCSWPRLVKWTLADQDSHKIQNVQVTGDTTVAAASVLAKASMLSRWQLQLHSIQHSAAVAAKIAKGDWPSLVGLYLGRTRLTRAVVQELVAANWPALTCLSAVKTPVDMGLLSLLSQARWPQLAYLHLPSSKLLAIHELTEMEKMLLPAMSNILSDETSVRSRKFSSSSSATIDWSSIITLDLTGQQVDTQMVTTLLHTGVNQLEFLVLNDVQLDAAAILQLTMSECPRLRSLLLSYTGLGSAAMSYLAQGKWPLLQHLHLKGNKLEDTALDELFTGEWPLLEELSLTVRSLHGKVVRWLGLSSYSVQEALRQPEQDVQVSDLKVKFSGSSADRNSVFHRLFNFILQPPLQPIRDVYPRLATVTLHPPRPWAI